jgi:hypothetical protein
MLKELTLVGVAIAVATSAQAMPRATPQAHSMITQVREGCGIGMVLVDGQCVSRHNLRVERRMDRRGYYGTGGTYGAAGYGAGPSMGTPAPVALEPYGARGGLDANARFNGIVCVAGTNIIMGGEIYLCQ